jgi:hypothetical protein
MGLVQACEQTILPGVATLAGLTVAIYTLYQAVEKLPALPMRR